MTKKKESKNDEGILYDLREHKYPSERGDSFRSLQVFECWVCKAITNQVVMGGWPGYGVRVICPNSSECWHHELEDKVNLLNKPHPKSYKDELKKEIAKYRKKHKNDIKNDILGNPDFNLKSEVTNVRSFGFGKSCPHIF